MANQPKGRGTQSNISDWQDYAKRNSFDQSDSKAQSRKDPAPVKAGQRISDWSVDWQQPQKREEGKGWRHWSELSQRNSYTGKGGSKRD
jgi:hypothetical protein